jgi:hypothetical protein
MTKNIHLSCLIFIALLFVVFPASAQVTLSFTVDQPPELIVDAGEDKAITKGDTVRIGGTETVKGGAPGYTYIWSPYTGLNKADVANPIASPDTTTTYTITVTDASGCSKSNNVTVAVGSPTGIEDEHNTLGLKIFPNPNDGSFHLITEKEMGREPLLLEITDPTGKLIYSERIGGMNKKLEKEIRLLQTNSGLYFLRVSGDKMLVVKKLVIY